MEEVVEVIPSPNGEQRAVVKIGDCGGATTDFFGWVDVESNDPRMQADHIFGFAGRPELAGFEVSWDSDSKLRISINSLDKVRRLHPEGRKSADLKVEYEFRY